MNVRQNRAKAQPEPVPDTRIAVEDVRARLYTLVRDRAAQGDRRAERLREWFESPEPGLPAYTTRWQDSGKLDKLVRAAGMRLAQEGSARSVGASGMRLVEESFGITPTQVEVLRQPLPEAFRRIPSEEMQEGIREFRAEKASEIFLRMLETELSRIDKAYTAYLKVEQDQTKLQEAHDAAARKLREAEERYERSSTYPVGDAYLKLQRLYEAQEKRSERRYDLERTRVTIRERLSPAFRVPEWAEILVLARWILARVAASTLFGRLINDREVQAPDSDRGLYYAVAEVLFDHNHGLLRGVSFQHLAPEYAGLRGRAHEEAPKTVWLQGWAQTSTAPLKARGGADALRWVGTNTALGIMHGQWLPSSYEPDRVLLSNGGWRAPLERLRKYLHFSDTEGGYLPVVYFHAAGKHKYVSTLIGRPLGEERTEIAGFRVHFYGMYLFASQTRFYDRIAEKVAVSLRIVREQAQRYFPALLREYKPSHLALNVAPAYDPSGGVYYRHGNTVVLYPHHYNAAKDMAKTWVHEMGHHVWTDYLSPAKRQVWIDAVEVDAPYDLTILREAMRSVQAQRGPYKVKVFDHLVYIWLKNNNGYMYVLTQRLADKFIYEQRDSSLGRWREGDAVGGLSKDTTLEEVEAMIAAKEAAGEAPMIYFKGLPTTVYGATNVEEGWCEALSYYIIYGPDAVLPQLRAAMRRLLPDMRRNPDDEDDETPPEGRG